MKKNSPKAALEGKFDFSDQKKKVMGEPKIASLSQAAVGGQKPGGFAAMMNKKKQDGTAQPGGGNLFKNPAAEKKDDDNVDMN